MTPPLSPEAFCPTCSTPGTGRFYANCGSSLEGTTCTGCEAPLTPGAKRLPEYLRHEDDITSAVTTARRAAGAAP